MEVIEVTEREVEIIEVIERGPQGLTGPTGPQGPQGPAGAAGAGLTTLTTAGDLLYRNNSEATRLPIGSNGQVLKVSGGLPAWANESGAVTSVNGATGAVTVAAAQHATEHEAGEADEIQAMAAVVTTDDASLNGIYVPNASGTTSGSRVTLYKTGTRQNTKLEYNQSLSIWQLIKNAVVQLSGQEINATYAWTTQQWLDERSPQVLPNGGTVTRAGLEVLARRAADGTSNVATATTSEDGLLSSADKTKLNGIATGATANSSDATLLNRANHTGTQAANTITGLAASATTDTTSANNISSGTLGIARIPTGTTSSTVALGNHSHELTALAATGATNGHILTANGSGGVTFAAAASGGTKTYAVFTAEHNQPPSTAFATLDTRNSIAVLDFDAATDENAVFVGIMPEAASLGSGLIVRLHWMATSATSGNVRWGVQFERSNTDLDADSFAAAVEANGAANGTSGILTTTAITVTDFDGITAGNVFRLKVFRNADDATNDTMTGDAELVAVELRSAA